MEYHPALAKGHGIVASCKVHPKPKRTIPKRKEPSMLYRQGHNSYPVEPLPNLNEEESLKLIRKK